MINILSRAGIAHFRLLSAEQRAKIAYLRARSGSLPGLYRVPASTCAYLRPGNVSIARGMSVIRSPAMVHLAGLIGVKMGTTIEPIKSNWFIRDTLVKIGPIGKNNPWWKCIMPRPNYVSARIFLFTSILVFVSSKALIIFTIRSNESFKIKLDALYDIKRGTIYIMAYIMNVCECIHTLKPF